MARAITKRYKAYGEPVGQFTGGHRPYCDVGHAAFECRLDLFHDADLAGDLADPKSKSGGVLCI